MDEEYRTNIRVKSAGDNILADPEAILVEYVERKCT